MFHFNYNCSLTVRPIIFTVSVQHVQNARRGQRCKESRGHKLIHFQSREMVIRVYNFMKKEADSGKAANINQIVVFLKLLVCPYVL